MFGICNLGFSLTFTLDEAISIASEHNEKLLMTRETVNSARAGIMEARANFLPQINAQGSYTRLAEVPAMDFASPKYGMVQVPVFGTMGDTIGFTVVPGIVGVDTMEFQMGGHENCVIRASLQQPLFTWGKLLNGYQISKLNLDVQEENYRKESNELVFNVTQSFYSILVLKEFVKLTEDAYKQMERHLEVVEKRYDAGLASKFDLLRTRVQLTNMKPQILKSKNGLTLVANGFKILLGLPQDTLVELKGELSLGEHMDSPLQECIDYAKVNRPEIKTLYLSQQMAGKALQIARRANLPNLAFIANYDYKKPIYFNNEWGTDWNVTLALQMPIFNGFKNIGEIRSANCRVLELEHGIKLLEDAIEMEVRAVFLQLDEAKGLLESQSNNIVQAEEALRIVEERYKEGLATSLEVMDMQIALISAKTNQLQSVSDYLIAKARLAKAIGK
ncbi:MAG: TolC family protein [Candidatus Stahlbacteria bacterium]|nr:TolC family protein [Candidatus Stahlbacteria bacterium]